MMNVGRCPKSIFYLGILAFVGLSSLSAASVHSSDAGKAWKKRTVKVVDATRYPDRVNQYGGDARYQTTASGFFEVTKQSGKWWLIDPEGHLFISKGMNSVRANRIGRQDEQSWAEDTYKLLVGNGFNTLGRWSDPESFESVGKSIPWCSSMSFMKDYVKRHASDLGKIDVDSVTIPVFDAEWPKFCDDYAMKHAKPLANDTWLLGHFSDNELPFRPDALRHYLDLPKSDEGHLAAVKWMKDNRLREDDVDDPDVQAEFLEVVAKLYFETVAAALKKADPNHLYIGSRLHGRCISEPVLRAANACDVVTINYYHAWEPNEMKAANWEKWSERPFIVSEFYAMKVASRESEAVGAGYRVLNHEDAGEYYHTFVAATLRNIPGCVGWHWFKYSDDNDIWQKGVVNDKGVVHQTLVDAMKVVNEQTYSLRELR